MGAGRGDGNGVRRQRGRDDGAWVGTFWEDRGRLTKVPRKSLCEQKHKFAVAPSALTPSVPLRAPLESRDRDAEPAAGPSEPSCSSQVYIRTYTHLYTYK